MDSIESKINNLVTVLNYDFSRFSMLGFIKHIANFRKRQVVLHPMELSLDSSGGYFQSEEVDYIIFNCSRTQLMQNHIILHELAHALLDHHGHKSLTSVEFEIAMSEFSRRVIGRFRQRSLKCDYVDEEEQEAEMFVRVVGQQVVQHNLLERLIGSSINSAAIAEFVDFIKD
jgi:hypothetical protein